MALSALPGIRLDADGVCKIGLDCLFIITLIVLALDLCHCGVMLIHVHYFILACMIGQCMVPVMTHLARLGAGWLPAIIIDGSHRKLQQYWTASSLRSGQQKSWSLTTGNDAKAAHSCACRQLSQLVLQDLLCLSLHAHKSSSHQQHLGSPMLCAAMQVPIVSLSNESIHC